MRLRNVKNKKEIINSSEYLILNPERYKGIWKSVFVNDNPIEIEIGMGKGDFIIGKALQNPHINYIGIEKYDSVVARAVQKIPQGLNNLKIIVMDAINIDSIFDKEIDIIYLNFSDPWPKKRHARRRLTSTEFLARYENVFKESKSICQKTDNRNLFEFSIVSLNESGYSIKEISLDLHGSDIENNIMTEYEKKFTKKGQVIYYLFASK